ncbi:T9SS type A sorting domain-containing protein [Winogradskyella ursingii]|uniref:T9SS type A sorting domain-containing protein n=1 Tax=Winogradskyella ursingii TaxID=2686079 RepID=UPI0015C77363|nr:T9SS type A sorting domain-containing protein [Winogradskyella ursingii]
MKTKLLSIACLIYAFTFTNINYAQTQLVAGDIAVILNRANAPDDFAFVTFVALDAGTVIYFTDCGADTADGFDMPCVGSEGAKAYTVPASGHAAGTIIRYDEGANTNFADYTDTRITGTFGLASSGGDQIIVFQDASSAAGSMDAGNNPMFIYAINNASSAFTGNNGDSNQTGLPQGLQDAVAPVSALGLGGSPDPQADFVENSIYNGSYTFNTIADAKLAITDSANYYTIDDIVAGEANENDATYASAEAAIPAALTITLSNDEFSLTNGISVYPNPSNGKITIKNSGIALRDLIISDINGRVISTIELNGATSNKNFDFSTLLTSGIYFLNISSENGSTVKKLVIE